MNQVSHHADCTLADDQTTLILVLHSLSENFLRSEGAAALAPALAANGSLTRLDVSQNYLDLGGHGVKMLRDAVHGREGFTLLDYSNYMG